MTLAQIRDKDAKSSSVTRVTRAWYIACTSADLRARPIERIILGQPMVLFRGEGGRAGALLDRCPHRNVPLSMGRVTEGTLECGYHGWRFDTSGECLRVPSLAGCEKASSRNAVAFGCREQDGFVWVWPDLEHAPVGEPFHFPLLDDARYTTVRDRVTAKASVHATAENALDVPHTSFLHAGLFRSDEKARNAIDVVVRRWPDRVEAEYIGEPRPEGVVGRVLSPGGGVVEHFDRFILPSIVQVEYRLGDTHLLVSAVLTPEEDYLTHLYTVISFRLPIPGWPIVPLLKPLALRIFGQDAAVLSRQTANIQRFGGERYVSTEVDVLGPHILTLLRAAERGPVAVDAASDKGPKEKRFQMEV